MAAKPPIFASIIEILKKGTWKSVKFEDFLIPALIFSYHHLSHQRERYILHIVKQASNLERYLKEHYPQIMVHVLEEVSRFKILLNER